MTGRRANPWRTRRPGGGTSRGEGLPVPVTDEASYSGSTDGSAGIDGDEEHPGLLIVVRIAFEANLRETGTLALIAKKTTRIELVGLSPLLEVTQTVENHGILLWVGNGHDLLTINLVPEVTELRRIDGECWAGVLGEGDTVRRVGNVLVLRCSSV